MSSTCIRLIYKYRQHVAQECHFAGTARQLMSIIVQTRQHDLLVCHRGMLYSENLKIM